MITAMDSETGRPPRQGRPVVADRLTRVSDLGVGGAMLWFSLLVLLPVAAIVITAADKGWSAFRAALTNEQAAAAIRLTVTNAIVVTAVNVVMSTPIAWGLELDPEDEERSPRNKTPHPNPSPGAQPTAT